MCKPNSKDRTNFAHCYGAAHVLTDELERMADDNGEMNPVSVEQIEHLKRLAREVVCAANAINSTHDGK
jgi:hypothetical protein